MTAVLVLMFVFLCVSVIDRITGNKYGYGADLDKGLATMGPVAMCLIGLYGMGTYLIDRYEEQLANLSQVMVFDPSIIVGSLLSTDFGSLPICLSMAETRAMGLFSGIALGATIGCTISFILPTCLAGIKGDKNIKQYLRGTVVGIALILPGAYLTGLLYDVPILTLQINCIPLTILCLALVLGFKFIPNKIIPIMGHFGNFIMAVCYATFAIISIGILFPKYALIDNGLLAEAVFSTAKMSVVIVGSLSFTKFTMRHFGPLLRFVGNRLKINEYSVVGIILSLTTTVAMIPIFMLMDKRGQKINAAFAVSGAFLIGGQMSYASSFLTSNEMVGFFACKIICAFLAVAVVCITDTWQYKRKYPQRFLENINENNQRSMMLMSNELSIVIKMVCAEKLLNAMENSAELNKTINELIDRFLNADWGDVSKEDADKNSGIVIARTGIVEAVYKTENGDFSVDMTFTDKEHATILVDYL